MLACRLTRKCERPLTGGPFATWFPQRGENRRIKNNLNKRSASRGVRDFENVACEFIDDSQNRRFFSRTLRASFSFLFHRFWLLLLHYLFGIIADCSSPLSLLRSSFMATSPASSLHHFVEVHTVYFRAVTMYRVSFS